MKVNVYFLLSLLFIYSVSAAQDCSSMTVTYTATESRCVATGSLTVSVTGGSGNFNYEAIGPVHTPVTSSHIITGLPGGHYTIRVTDVGNGCVKELVNALVPGSYQDPRFQLTKTDATCAGKDGAISALNVQNGRSPFVYTIIAPSPSHVGTSNATGTFTGLTSGEYYVQLTDSCGGIQVRAVTIENYSWWFDQFSVTRADCDSADVFVKVSDNKGNSNTSGGALSGFAYGVVRSPGDTVWSSAHSFRVLIGKRRNLTVVARDGCGNIQSSVWNLPASLKPSLNNASLSNLGCTSFTASITGQNLTNPEFCLYDNNNVQIACNQTGVFPNLSYGNYCIRAIDLCYDTVITRCFTAARAVPSVNSPVGISGQNCSTFTATITGKQNLSGANYCLYDASNALMECNSSGVFNNVPYGSYCIRIANSCADTTITRCFTVSRPVATLTSYNITGSTCSTFTVSASGNNLVNPTYCLYDAQGNRLTCNNTGVFPGLEHGNYCIRTVSCGDTTAPVCFGSARPVPSVAGSVQTSNKQCNTFTAAITGQTNLTNPQYCIYDANDALVDCNATGVFNNLADGANCIKVVNSCYDTTITRCFSETQPPPSLSNSLQLLGSTCSTVSFQATGSNLTSPSYCLYDANDNLLACNNTGTFSNYPYGTYCVVVEDGCTGTRLKACATFTPTRGLSLSTSKSCTIGSAFIDIQFANGNAPYTVDVYHPDGSLVHHATTPTNPFRMELPALPPATQYKVVGTDHCGNKDSAAITPDANLVTKAVSVRAKCPSSAWLNGAGDLRVTTSTNHHSVLPRIIKKNGAGFARNYSSLSGSTYTFADLEPAEYIVEYTQSVCNSKLYDTVLIPPYAYPSQGQSAIYQCDNNSFSLGADVAGGVGPYSFQIIGSMPSAPAITTGPQNSPVFNINTGTTYSLVRLRTVDACGNATLSDVSVLPLQNVSVTASDSCFYRNITLSVDNISNASYAWYRKNSPTDSTQVSSGASYNLPFFVPEQSGLYVCKMTLNDGCITRLSYFRLDGSCGMEVLPSSLRLHAQKTGSVHQLSWSHSSPADIKHYVVERKGTSDAGYLPIGQIAAQTSNRYIFHDTHTQRGVNLYLRLIHI